jgi:ABC-type multidrug transport system fused ATPase/permease subunit
MGLVMQEPVLFNYSIHENILYGKSDASNNEIVEAAQIANAREFVESADIAVSFGQTPHDLLKAMVDNKAEAIEELGQEEFDKACKNLGAMDKEGKSNFLHIENIFDERPEDVKNKDKLHQGYYADCGTKGSKLSGG